MPFTDAMLASCRTSISALPELTTFRAARTLAETATRSTRVAAWYAAYQPSSGVQSPAYLLRLAIRGVVNAQGDSTGGASLLERESAYRTLVAEFVPERVQPPSPVEELQALNELIALDRLS